MGNSEYVFHSKFLQLNCSSETEVPIGPFSGKKFFSSNLMKLGNCTCFRPKRTKQLFSGGRVRAIHPGRFVDSKYLRILREKLIVQKTPDCDPWSLHTLKKFRRFNVTATHLVHNCHLTDLAQLTFDFLKRLPQI